MQQTAVVSCILGTSFRAVYPAPLAGSSFFFTNQRDLESEIEDKGWECLFLDIPLSSEGTISSLQAKYVKYLQFLRDGEHEWASRVDEIVYTDHKFFVKPKHLQFIVDNRSRDILVRKTPRLKTTVWDEFDDAMRSDRYRRFMPQTKAFIEQKLSEGYSATTPISNTGLIAYNHKNPRVLTFVDQMYAALTNIGTSECQIIWALLSQRYVDLIQHVDWKAMAILWEPPR